MAKGSTAKHRGPTRLGTGDPPELAETLQACIKNPRLLDGLPPAERELRQKQIAGYQATREARSAASKAGWIARREAEAARLIDRLSDPDVPDEAFDMHLDETWDSLSARQQQVVTDWLDAHPEWPGDGK